MSGRNNYSQYFFQISTTKAPFSPFFKGERVPEGRVRGFENKKREENFLFSTHPALRATFSHKGRREVMSNFKIVSYRDEFNF